jgi:hypothetical protein
VYVQPNHNRWSVRHPEYSFLCCVVMSPTRGSNWHTEKEHNMTSAIDTDDWLRAIALDPELTAKDLLAGDSVSRDRRLDRRHHAVHHGRVCVI